MNLSTALVVSLFLPLACLACGSPEPGADSGESDVTKGKTHAFKCTADTARYGKWDKNRFASFDLELSATTAKMRSVVYTSDYVGELSASQKDEQAVLAKGVESNGKPLSADTRARIASYLDQLGRILAADHSLAFDATNKPYVRPPKKPTAQFPLEVGTAGIKAETLWETLGNEGDGARLLLPPEMLAGTAAKPDIEFEGTQGPVWDRYDCKR